MVYYSIFRSALHFILKAAAAMTELHATIKQLQDALPLLYSAVMA